ncbi:MAG: 4-hydroxybenzoyl-CoA reductase subunit beta [Myxococcales bacterium]|nr:4-hydroxybenzoyl-CoA reductase subunit beta [Myxococcales bacterium]
MLRLPIFQTKTPTNLEELLSAMSESGARLIAGGTDLLPNLKHRLDTPETLVSIDRVEELRHITWDEDARALRIGAGVTLADIAADNEVGEHFPSLVKAASLVASPLIRNMATLGGNINLDTRCRYVNQSEFWRSAIGGCLKSEGDVCHVVPKGRSCAAAMSSDCVPVLISLGATLIQVGPQGRRELALVDYYSSDGIEHTQKLVGEITTEVQIPLPAGESAAHYSKWTVRKSIDFPLLSIAMNFTLSSQGADAVIEEAIICLGVLAAKPKVLRTDKLVGLRFGDEVTASLVGELCFKHGKTLENVPYEADYRRSMLRVFGRRAIRQLADSR